jgi:hypothetical protein
MCFKWLSEWEMQGRTKGSKCIRFYRSALHMSDITLSSKFCLALEKDKDTREGVQAGRHTRAPSCALSLSLSLSLSPLSVSLALACTRVEA